MLHRHSDLDRTARYKKRKTGWRDNFKNNLKETECEDFNWIDMAKNRDKWRALVNTVKHIRVP
jgi:hypothetical protein